jgi:pimeloyl-ACP methyl ester carboxylesterase
MAKKKESEIQGITRLITDATVGVTDIVENMHHKVVHVPFLPSTPVQNLISFVAGLAYKNIRWSTKIIGGTLDMVLGQLAPLIGDIKASDKKEAIVSALNGVIGDYLVEKENPLKIKMQFRLGGKPIPMDSQSLMEIFPAINGKVLIMVHGSCMNDIQWTRKEQNHGEALAKELGLTPLYLHYNSGLHVSTNGQYFNELLEKTVKNWPVPVKEIVILAHSMGGLVGRSAVYYGVNQKKTWAKKLKKFVFLGTPHHGAPLEQTGNYLDIILESIHYTKPFAKLGKMRSAGITDLRYGNLVDEDWHGTDRFEKKEDQRQIIPLPKGVDCYAVAANLGKTSDGISSQIVGDGLVAVKSALGEHKNLEKDLNFKKENTWVVHGISHTDLLSNPEVYNKIKDWLA